MATSPRSSSKPHICQGAEQIHFRLLTHFSTCNAGTWANSSTLFVTMTRPSLPVRVGGDMQVIDANILQPRTDCCAALSP